MNIAILIPNLTTGGAERAASELGNHLCDIGDKVYYFLLANSGRVFFEVSGEIVKTHIPYPFDRSSPAANIREMVFAARRLRNLKRKYEIDVCISFMEGCNVLNICSRSLEERVIISVRTVLSKRREYDGVFLYSKGLLKNIYRFADRIVAVSDGVCEDLIDNYEIKREKLVTIPNVSRQQDLITNNDETKVSEWAYGNKTIVCVGRMDIVKQFDSILRAFSAVHRTEPDARLVFVGDGRQMNHMKSLRKSLGLENVVFFVGFQKNIGIYLKNARCFVMASKAEGFPNAMVEAMAYGVPIISTDTPGGCGEILGRNDEIKGVVHCEYGVMTPYIYRYEMNDEELSDEEVLLGKAMTEMLCDYELNAHYAGKATERSQFYGIDNVMRMWDELLRG